MAESTHKQALEVVAWDVYLPSQQSGYLVDDIDDDQLVDDMTNVPDAQLTPLVRLSDAQAAIAQAIQDEREACAKVCAQMPSTYHENDPARCAEGIRARKD